MRADFSYRGCVMSVSHAIENYLSVAHVYYQVLQHNFTASSFDSACSAHVPASAVVKAVMLRDRHTGEFAMALIPASNRLKLSWLPSRFADMQLAQEDEFNAMFPDCAQGAVPGFGQAFQVDMVWDEELLEPDKLFFEGGDHQALVAIDQFDFRDLFGRYSHGVISLPNDIYCAYHADELRGVH
ncbi:MAG: deacylase [Halioglobus sp.]|nr:deacylase [Halioglobus sp.]